MIDKASTQHIQIIRHQSDRLRLEEQRENSKVPETISDNEFNEDEEDFEEVIGSGLTSETASNRGATPKTKPKTIPGKRLQPKPAAETSSPEKDRQKIKNSKIKNRKKTGKTSVNLENEETTQTVITEIEFLMPKTSQDFEKQLANMKHIPQASKPPPSKFKIPATLRFQTNHVVALPPLIAADKPTKQKLKHQFQAEYDKFSDKEFYKDFHFQFIPLPLPTEELPRKSVSIKQWRNAYKVIT